VKKNGDVVDVLLSAIAEKDAGGHFVRSSPPHRRHARKPPRRHSARPTVARTNSSASSHMSCATRSPPSRTPCASWTGPSRAESRPHAPRPSSRVRWPTWPASWMTCST
jgi:hypothetical protein